MPFLSGRLTCWRFRVKGRAPRSFGPDQLDQLHNHRMGTQRQVSADGVQAGWVALDHILDTRFDLAKNVINDALHFGLRVDTVAIPSDLLRAYTQVELEGLAAENPSGHPSSRQKRDAKQLARERLEREAQDGRFTRRRVFPILWDALSGELLVGTTSVSAIDRLHPLFEATFGLKLDMLGAGRQAFSQAEASGQKRSVDDARPSVFTAGAPSKLAWLPDENNRDFIGNEFLLWLWYFLETEGESVPLSDGSKAEVTLARTLSLECPRGQTGKESISSDGPTRLPEAHRAIQAGKLPRKVGLLLARHDQPYELTLQAETLAISGAKLTAPEGEEERARLEARVGQIRHLLETLDLLYQAFLERRLGDAWTKELGRMKKWLKAE
ncbi:MAG: hypothetical protein U0793_12860 [Gemmataceae bacterium]